MIPTGYTVHHGHDPDTDRDILLTTWADGSREVAFRPGRNRTELTWGAPVSISAVSS